MSTKPCQWWPWKGTGTMRVFTSSIGRVNVSYTRVETGVSAWTWSKIRKVPIQYHRLSPWESLPSDAVSIPIFGVDKWHLLRDRLLRAVVPRDDSGLVVDFEYAEYFLYYDQTGKFTATRLQDKPADYRAREVLHFVEFMRRGRPLLDAFLREGITNGTGAPGTRTDRPPPTRRSRY